MTSFHDRCAIFAHATRLCRGTTVTIRPDAIDPFGNNPCSGGFAGAANARHHKSLRDPVCFEGILKRAHHRFLTNKIGEGFRAIFSRENSVFGGWCVAHINSRIRVLDDPNPRRLRGLEEAEEHTFNNCHYRHCAHSSEASCIGPIGCGFCCRLLFCSSSCAYCHSR